VHRENPKYPSEKESQGRQVHSEVSPGLKEHKSTMLQLPQFLLSPLPKDGITDEKLGQGIGDAVQ
jgi:hypothetical protein